MGLIQGSVSQNTARLRSFIYFWDASPSQEWKILNNMTKVRYIPLIDTNNPSYDWNGTLSAMLTNINNVIKNNYGSYNSNTTNGYTWSASNSPTGRVAESMLEATSPGYYEVDVPHNSDGTKPDCLLACSFSLPSGGYGPGNVNISGQVALASIPRASEVTVPAGNIGEAVSININKYSVGFTSTLKYECGALNGTIVEKTPQSTWGWIIPESFYELIPNASSIQCKIICETYNGLTLLGTKETFFTANANPITNTPDLSAVIIDINSKTVALTGSNEKFVRFISNARAVITASAKNFATVVTRKFDCADGKTGLGTSVDLIAVESGDFTVSTIDSRGFSKAVSYTKDIVEYIKLTVNASFKRNTATDNRVKLSFNGNYFNNTFGVIANTLQVKYRYKKTTDAVWSAFYTLTPVISGNAYSGTDIILAPGGVQTVFAYADAWEFELYAYDKIFDTDVIKYTEVVGPGEPNFAIGKDFFEHYANTFFKKNLEVAGVANLNGVTNALGLISAVAGMNLSAPIEPMKIRYIRDYLTSNSLDATKQWAQIGVYTLNGAVNRALNRVPTASATTTNLAYATDGTLVLGEHANCAVSGVQYIQIDLGSVYTDLAYIKVWHYYGDNRWFSGHKVEVSEDGVTWIKIYDVVNTGEIIETVNGNYIPIPNTKPILIGGGGTNKMEYIGYADGSSQIFINNKPLIQSGINDKGGWTRYYDGTQTCYGSTVTVNSGAGTELVFPNLFWDTSYSTTLFASGIASGGLSASYVSECYPVSRKSFMGKVLLHTPTTITNPGNTGVRYMAIGRWY